MVFKSFQTDSIWFVLDRILGIINCNSNLFVWNSKHLNALKLYSAGFFYHYMHMEPCGAQSNAFNNAL